MGWWHLFKEWFLSPGEKYNVNPYLPLVFISVRFLCFFFRFTELSKIGGIKTLCASGFAYWLLFYFRLFIPYYCWQKHSGVGVCFHCDMGGLWILWYCEENKGKDK